MEDKILEFIHRRFPEDCHWTDGNCYWFAKILCDRFGGEPKGMEICYDPVPGHFVAYSRGRERAYDWNGYYFPYGELIPLWRICIEDPQWYARLVRDCVE